MSSFLSLASCSRDVLLTCALAVGLLNAPRVQGAEAKQPKEAAHSVKPEMELLITHPSVLNSPAARYPGVWSFGHLMEQLAGPEQAANFTLEWLRQWLQDQTVNRDVAPARTKLQELVLDPWRKRDQAANDEDDDPFHWTPNLAHAPFKLIAIVNRMDLVAPGIVLTMQNEATSAQQNISFLQGNLLAFTKVNPQQNFTLLNELVLRESPAGEKIVEELAKRPRQSEGTFRKPDPPISSKFVALEASAQSATSSFSGGYGGSGGASGEGRLVFAVTDAAGAPLEPSFTVIFEYALSTPFPSPARIPNLTKFWAEKWHHLGTHADFDQAYLSELAEVTTAFTESRVGISASILQSPPPLAQVRSNDGALGEVREFRQFTLETADAALQLPPLLRLAPVSQTPADHYQDGDQEALAKVLKPQLADFRKTFSISLPQAVIFAKQTEPMGVLGARSTLPGPPSDFRWVLPAVREKSLAKELSLHTCNGCHGAETPCENGSHLHAGAAGTQLSAFLSAGKDGLPQGEMKERAFVLKMLLEVDDPSNKVALLKLLQRRHRTTH